MPNLKDRSLLDDVLRDQAKKMLGRTPVQSWLKPDRVELNVRRVTLRSVGKPPSKTAADYLRIANTQGAGIDESAIGSTYRTEMEFVLEQPWGNSPTHANRVRPNPDILERFLLLATASDQQIQKFAASFGALLVFGEIEKSKTQI